jgi:hypothetical protein
MSAGTLSAASLALIADRIWAPSTSLGRLILLRGDLYSNTFTVNTSTDILTTATPHGMVTGSRVRLSTTGTLPVLNSGTLNTTTDYFWIADTTTTGKIATTLANALAGTAIDFTGTGSGSHTLTEQRLTDADPITVLINKELNHASYSRQEITGLAAATAIGAVGEKAPFSATYSATGTAMVFRHVLFLRGATGTIGNTTGTEPQLTTESADVSVNPGAPKIVTIILRARNAA